MKKGILMMLVAGLVLAAATPRDSGAQEAFAASNYGNVFINGQGSTIVQMALPAGLYMAHAKLSMSNLDGDNQSGHCKLWTVRGGSAIVHDVSHVRLGEFNTADRQIITLQAVISEPPDTIETFFLGVYCSSFHAVILDAVLMALSVTAVQSPGPTPYTLPPDQACPVCPF